MKASSARRVRDARVSGYGGVLTSLKPYKGPECMRGERETRDLVSLAGVELGISAWLERCVG